MFVKSGADTTPSADESNETFVLLLSRTTEILRLEQYPTHYV